MTEYFVLKKIPTGDTKVPLAEAIADLGYVHIESVAAMLEERKKQKGVNPCDCVGAWAASSGKGDCDGSGWKAADGLICGCGHDRFMLCEDNKAMCLKCGTIILIPGVLRDRPSLKFLPCPSCGRKLMANGVLSGTCCICDTDLALPACPHCGHDTFKAWLSASLVNAKFKADGTLSSPKLYFFICAKCGKEVGTLPLKRDDK